MQAGVAENASNAKERIRVSDKPTIYIVTYNIPYEGYGIAGVFSTLAAAIERAERDDLRPKYSNWCQIVPYVLDESTEWFKDAKAVWRRSESKED